MSPELARHKDRLYPVSSTGGKRPMTNRERILDLLRAEPGLTDGEIRERLETPWHSMVNQECHTLEAKGLIERRMLRGRIRNCPIACVESSSGRRRRVAVVEWPR